MKNFQPQTVAKDNYYDIDLKILDRKECESQGMGAYLAVAKGSDLDPKFIHLKYSPKNAKNKVVLIGKGLTFDSGGYNLKVGASQIEKMNMRVLEFTIEEPLGN